MADYHDIDGNPVSLHKLCRTEPEWAANRIKDLQAELAESKKAYVDLWEASIIEGRRLRDALEHMVKRLERTADHTKLVDSSSPYTPLVDDLLGIAQQALNTTGEES